MHDLLPVPLLPTYPSTILGRCTATLTEGVTHADDVIAVSDEFIDAMRNGYEGTALTIGDEVRIVMGWPGLGMGRVVYRVIGWAPIVNAYIAERIA